MRGGDLVAVVCTALCAVLAFASSAHAQASPASKDGASIIDFDAVSPGNTWHVTNHGTSSFSVAAIEAGNPVSLHDVDRSRAEYPNETSCTPNTFEVSDNFTAVHLRKVDPGTAYGDADRTPSLAATVVRRSNYNRSCTGSSRIDDDEFTDDITLPGSSTARLADGCYQPEPLNAAYASVLHDPAVPVSLSSRVTIRDATATGTVATLAVGVSASSCGAEPAQTPGGVDVASTCGTARFDWYTAVLHERFLRKGRKACVFVVSNRVARELVKLAFAGPTDDGRDMTQEFFRLLKTQVIADTEPDLDKAQDAYDKLQERLKDEPFLKKAIPDFAKGVEKAGKADPLYKAADVLLDNLRATLGFAKLDLIVGKDACFAIRADMRSSKTVRAEGSILQNPSRTSDREASKLTVIKRIDRHFPRSDKFERMPTNLACNKKGLVTTSPLRETKKVFKHRKTSVGRATQ